VVGDGELDGEEWERREQTGKREERGWKLLD
jgi:hypothetical protein